MALHKNLIGNDMHVVHAYTYSDATARESATGFSTTDIGKIALQTDTKSFWLLVDPTPIWAEATRTTPSSIHNRIIVGSSGTVNFTHISDAVAYAISQSASLVNPWVIQVFPGIYVESNPIVVPVGITIMGQSGLSSSCTVMPENPLDDLFVTTGGILNGLTFSGVTDPLKAQVRVNIPDMLAICEFCLFTNTSTGLIIENGAIGAIENCFWSGNTSQINTGIKINGPQTRMIMANSGFIAFTPSLTLFAGLEPITTCIEMNNGASANIFNCSFLASSNKINATTILINDADAQLKLLGCAFEDGYIGIKISASGANAIVIAESCTIFNYTRNFIIESSTASIFEKATTDDTKIDIVSGADITGITGVASTQSTLLAGHVDYIYSTPGRRTSEIPKFLHDKNSTGLSTGGAVSQFTGLEVLVTAGTGWISRNFYQDTFNVSWDTTTIMLSPSSTNYVVYDGTDIAHLTSEPNTDSILLATVFTDGYSVRYIHNTSNKVVNSEINLYQYLLTTRKFALHNGLAVSQGSSLTKLNIDTGEYYLSSTLIDFIGDTDISFSYFYDNGNTEISLQTDLDITNYDNGGVLTAMTDGYYRTDTVYLTSDNRVSLIYGTDEFESNTTAGEQPANSVPSFIEPSGFAVANIVIQKDVGIDTIIDLRVVANSSVSSGGGVSDHGLLSGLLDDDHTQYLLTNGFRSMGGDLNLGANDIINVSLINGVDIDDHSARHNPGGADALATGIPVTVLVGATPSVGSASSFAVSDHQHGIGSAVPLTLSTSNSQGVASTVSRSDHVHAHGNLPGGATHALVVANPGGTAGYMSPSDKQKLDGVEDGATNTPLTNDAPLNVNKTSASAGVSTEVARSDHKHDISTGVPIPVSTANAEGSATTLARSDHVHAHGVIPGGSTHALVISDPGGTAGYMSSSDKQKLDGIASGATNTPLTNTAPVDVTKAAAVVGVATDVARADHKHDISTATAGSINVGDAASEGSATSLSRSDHTHSLTSPGAPANVTKAAASAGVATTVARSDHKHDISTAAPVAFGTANAEGTATSLARSDHVHRANVLQNIFTEISTNTTTTSTTFVDLLSQSITTTGGNLLIHFTCSASNSNAGKLVTFRITVDAVSKRGTQIRVSSANDAESASIVTKVTGLSSGSHTVKIQWLTDANTASIQPVLRPDVEHASLLITETTL